MEKKIEKTKNNKGLFIVGGIIVAVVIIVVLCFTLGFGKKSNEKEIENSLTEMGKSFYENFYYEQVGSSSDERNTLLSKFTTIGIKVDLENLARYNDGEFSKEIKELKNNKTNKACNKTNTKIIIYPKSPYGKTDYTIKVKLDCGFSDKK